MKTNNDANPYAMIQTKRPRSLGAPTARRWRAPVTPYSVADLRVILDAVIEPLNRAVVAIAAFGGLRATEIVALSWEDYLPHQMIVRSRSPQRRRIVPVQKVLSCWLEPFQGRKDPVIKPLGFIWRMERLLTPEEHGTELSFLRLRRSYLAYRIAQIGDPRLVMQEAASYLPLAMPIHNHGITKSMADAWFASTPDLLAKKVL